MNEHIVTIKLINSDNLREMNVHTTKVLHVPGEFFMVNEKGQQVAFRFKDESGAQATDIMIKGHLDLNMNNAIDKHNLKVFKSYLEVYPAQRDIITIHDPEAEADDDIARNELILDLCNILRDHDNDTEWLAKLYRRVIGPSSGIGHKVVYKNLIQNAREFPEKFISPSQRFFFEEAEFEMIAWVDKAIEIGFFVRAQKGDSLSRRNGQVYAESFNNAVFKLTTDLETMEMLRYEVQGRPGQPETYIPVIENTELNKLAGEVGEILEENDLDFNIDDDQKAEADRVFIDGKINTLVELGHIEIVKVGKNERFKIPNQTLKFGRTELIAHFLQNNAQFDDMLRRAAI